MKIDNDIISLTEENEIFVFGSNGEGMHNGGAARYAMDNYGAIYGQANGIQGRSYAIDTMTGLLTLSLEIGKFEKYASENKDKEFILTPIGCGIAGYDPGIIAPFFRKSPEECYPPKRIYRGARMQAKELIKLRKSLGLDRAEFAELTGYAFSTIKNMELGINKICTRAESIFRKIGK